MADLLWSELRLEDGSGPGPDDVVVVNAGDRLIFDEAASPATVKGLVIHGEFTVEDAGGDLELTTDWAVALGSGTFRVGTPEDPYQSKFTLTLAGKDPDNDVDLGDYTSADGSGMTNVIQNNDAFLMAMGANAAIEIHVDDAAKESWTQLDTTAEAGDTGLTFTEATGWEVGDRIAVASTDFDLNQTEEFTIVSVDDGGRTVTVDRPLDYMHYGEIETYDNGTRSWDLDMRAEVALLSRDVTIQGDVDYASTQALNEQDDQFGGHTMVMMGGEMHVSGAEFAYMGQAGILGRYPLHWHLSGDVTGQYIESSSIHHSFNKGITVHGTDSARVADNVVYETISHNYYFEDGSETDNVLDGNLGMNAREPGEFGAIRGADDTQPSNFYTKNGHNTWTGNHAAGSEDKGFYFSLGRSEGRDFDTFVDNTAHSSEGRSFYLNHGGLVQDGSPSGDADQPQKVDPWEVEGFTAYKSNGVYVRGVEGTFTESAFAELGSNARFRLNQTIEDSLIVGRSEGNIGNPDTEEEFAEARSLPSSGHFEGFQLYDGPGGLSSVHFDGFEGDDEAIALSNAIHKTASFFVEDITWGERVDEASKLTIGGGGNAIGNDSWARGIVDVDGSLTGVPGSMIYQWSRDRDGSDAFNAGESYEIIEEWGAIVTYGTSSATLRIDSGTLDTNTGNNHGNAGSNLSVTRSDGEYATGLRKQIPVFFDYTYELDYASINDEFRLYLHDADWGQSVIFNLGPVPTDSSFTLNHPNSGETWTAREVSSMAMLEASPDTAVYRAESGEVYIKLVAEMAHGYLWPQPGATYDYELHSGVTVLVDTEAGVDLDALVFDDPEPGDLLPPPPYAEGQAPPAEIGNGTEGHDSIRAREGNDTIFGGDGDDTILGGSGYDLLEGGDGDDSISAFGGRDTIEGGEGHDTLTGSNGNDRIFGGLHNDLLVANDGHDRMVGGQGNDTLIGGDGANRMTGNAGYDSLSGGGGDDVLMGNDGRDTLDGGEGNDHMIGGEKADLFIYRTDGAVDVDVIVDFTDDVDTIHLTDLGYTARVVDGSRLELSWTSGHVLRLEGVTDADSVDDDVVLIV
ncbi:MAG: G8 domain-containing protein [Pseudomonadota bacterium]